MKDISALFAESLREEERWTTEAMVWSLAYGNAVVRAVNYTEPLTLDVGDGAGSQEFQIIPFTRGSMEFQGDLQVDHLAIQFPNLQFFVQYSAEGHVANLSDLVLNGVLDMASVWIYLVNLRNLGIYRHSLWDVVGAPDIGRSSVTIQLQSALGRALRRTPRTLLQEQCNNSLYDDRCTITQASKVVTGSATGGTRYSMTSALSQPDFYFDLGQVQFVSGLNVGAVRTIGKHLNAGGNFIWSVPLRFEVCAGDQFQALPGCNKAYATCASAKFGNTANFRGFPNVPVPESVL